MTYDASKVAFVDVETTGLDPELDHIWQVAVIVNGVGHSWIQRLPNPRVVSNWVVENTRFTELYVHEEAWLQQKSIDRFVELVGDRHLVGACPWFDSERLHRLVREYRNERLHPWHYHLIDIETLIVGHLMGLATAEPDGLGNGAAGWELQREGLPWDSRELSRYVGVDPDQFFVHDATDDVWWAKACFEAVMGGPE